MLKRSILLLPKFSFWIGMWTLISWYLFLPTRILSKLTLGSLNLDYSILSPDTHEFQMLMIDAIRDNPNGYLSFILLALVSGLISLIFAIGILPALAQMITTHSTGRTSNGITKSILKAWPDHILPMLWRFLAWSIITGLLISASAKTLSGIDLGVRPTLSILFVEWVIMLSWWTHTSVLWGQGERKCMRKGLVRLVKKVHIILIASCFWFLCSVLAAGIQYFQLKLTLLHLGPMVFSQILFFLGLFILHVGKFLWVGSHSSDGDETNTVSDSNMNEPPIRRIFT